MKMTFDELNLAAAIVQAVREQGYETPTPIQAEAIPAVMAGQDLLAGAQTGTGKTAVPYTHLDVYKRQGQRALGCTHLSRVAQRSRQCLAPVVNPSVCQRLLVQQQLLKGLGQFSPLSRFGNPRFLLPQGVVQPCHPTAHQARCFAGGLGQARLQRVGGHLLHA